MNRSVVLLIIVATIGLGGYLYWDGLQKTPRFVADGGVIHALPDGTDPGVLTAEGFDKDQVMSLLASLPEDLSGEFSAMLNDAGDDTAARSAALEKIRAAFGL